jgi:hypothetical protein
VLSRIGLALWAGLSWWSRPKSGGSFPPRLIEAHNVKARARRHFAGIPPWRDSIRCCWAMIQSIGSDDKDGTQTVVWH